MDRGGEKRALLINETRDGKFALSSNLVLLLAAGAGYPAVIFCKYHLPVDSMVDVTGHQFGRDFINI